MSSFVQNLFVPYTPAHPIFVAPIWYLSNQRLPLVPLVVGSLSPDLPYLLALTPVSAPGHYPLGLMTHAVPHGLVLLSLWYALLERPLLSLFSLPIPRRQWSFLLGLKIGVSLLLGAMSHALIDATSHRTGWFVQNFSIFRYDFLNLPIYKWIQYGSGIFGLILIALWYWPYRDALLCKQLELRSVAIATLIFAVSSLSFIVLANGIHQTQSLQSLFVNSATGIMTGGIVGACLYSLFFYYDASRERG